MTYGLGIDLGTTWASAATSRGGRVDVITLGDREAAVPSLVHFAADGTVTTGEAAARSGSSRGGDEATAGQSRTAREFKRRIGDQTPILLGGTAFPPERLVAHQLRAVLDAAVARQGEPPAGVVVTHPATWGPFKVEQLGRALDEAGLPGATLITDSMAIATDHRSRADLETGSKFLIYRLGGATFATAVVQQGLDRLVPVGPANGVDRLGGNDFDQAVFDHVRAALAGAIDELERDDPAVRTALLRLRSACASAKEALSDEAEVSIPVLLPGLDTSVRLTRTEFERAIRPMVTDTLGLVRRTVVEAGLELDDLAGLLLAGGSAAVPIVNEILTSELGLPVMVGPHPRFAAARGAAVAADPAAPTANGDRASHPAGQQVRHHVAAAALASDPSKPTDHPEAESIAALASRTSILPLTATSAAAVGNHTSAQLASGLGRGRSRRLPASMAAAVIAAVLVSGGGAAAAFGAGPFADTPGPDGPGTESIEQTTLTTVSPVRSTSEPEIPTTDTAAIEAPTTTAAPGSVAPTVRPPTTAHHETTVHQQTTAHHESTTTETTAPSTETTISTTTTEPETTLTISPQPTTREVPIFTLVGPPIDNP